ncbi:hypothetical protein Ddye_003155 [Dipteronia dyeriana]|uniref:Uncharacterized protein n=1 Tax=Dipteronia dyeriana TaxID=168575 RepID=A0AAD9XSD0_9ROSI|nr:hypothetical protein Ddye_003155 [Dipteronia dyeriana]
MVRIGKKLDCMKEWSRRLRCKQTSLSVNYLGVPLGGRPNSVSFLNKEVILVLIKAVLSSIPTYYMSIFKLSAAIANNIEKLQRSFFLGDGMEMRKMRLVRWDLMYQHKRNDGFGIGKILDKNKRLLAKWIWRFSKDVYALWNKVLCVKYNCSVLEMRWEWEDNDQCGGGRFMLCCFNALMVVLLGVGLFLCGGFSGLLAQ